MRRVNWKSGLIIIAYSLILSIVLGIGMFSIRNSFTGIDDKTSTSGIRAIIINTEIKNQNEIANDFLIGQYHSSTSSEGKTFIENEVLNSEKLVAIEDIGKVYLRSGFEDILIMMIIFFVIFIIASFLLWMFLNKIHNKEIENIVKKLNTLDDDFDPYLVSTSFGIAYDNIKEKFKQNFDDYKKLNSYISHEQKNAIAVLRTKLEIDNKSKYINLLDKISDSIDDILTLSNLKLDEEMIPVDVSLICASLCDTYAKTYKNIEFDFDCDNTTILGKEKWIYRAVSNLVDNAVKYGEGKAIQVSVKNKYNSVIIEVKDNGIGMERSFIEKIFNNKYRINDLNKDGYGIGLSLVSHVCDLCNGIILVDSEIGRGSCFYLSFLEYNNEDNGD